jgi:SAM-dependent methyltransferase
MNGAFDFLTAFELAEHVFDPEGFFQKAYQLLKPGGHFLLTTLSGKGFDTLLLWERSKSISPPHHLNFFNPRSIERLLKRLGFETAECVTPGRLDWDIVEGMIRKDGVSLGRFWDHLCQEGNEQCKAEIQAWISRNRLSSHMRVLARRPREA